MKSLIYSKLQNHFNPTKLIVEDKSHLHIGHVGHKPDGGTHFKVTISADKFDGISLVDSHRLINSALAKELQEKIHALEIRIIK